MDIITYDDLIARQDVIAAERERARIREPETQLQLVPVESHADKRRRELEHAAAIGVLDQRFIDSI